MSKTQALLPFRPGGDGAPAGADYEPAARLLAHGGCALNDSELLGLLLPPLGGTGQTRLAAELIERFGGLERFQRTTHRELEETDLEPAQRVALLAAFELACRVARAGIAEGDLLDRPGAVAEYVRLRYARGDQEVMGALYLDVRNRLLVEDEIYRGTLSRAAVEPRAILKRALLHDACGFILWHTHPSGDPAPSAEDLDFTRRMAEAAEAVGVRLVDHLILGGGDRWVSLKRRGAW